MRTLKHLAFCLATVFLAIGCNQEDNEPQTTAKKGNPAEFTMTINGGTNTRTITTQDGNNRTIAWRQGDQVGIFAVNADGTPQNNCKYIYDGTEWKAENIGDAITLTNGENYSFYAYYPYAENITVTTASLNVLPDQSATQGEGNSNYDLSDILISKVDESTYNGASINLNYSHAYAMVEVLVAGDKVGDTAPEKVVLKNVITDANINLTTQEVTNTTNKQDVVMAYVENNENTDTYLYRAIVPEQIIAQGSTLLEVYGVNGGKNYVFKAPNKDVTYPQGKYFRMEVTIGENNVGIKFPTGSIEPWEPTPGIDLEGEELKENLITKAISGLTNDDFQTITSIDYFQEGDFWYVLNNKEAEIQAELKNENGENYISFTTQGNPTGSWFKSSIGYHHKQKFQPTYYKLTFKSRADKAGSEMRIFIRTYSKSETNLFFCNSLGKTGNLGAIKPTQEQVNANEWITQELFYDFTKATTSTGGNPSSTDIKNIVESSEAYEQFELKFVSNKNAGLNPVNFHIKDVKFEPISFEDIPENQRPTE